MNLVHNFPSVPFSQFAIIIPYTPVFSKQSPPFRIFCIHSSFRPFLQCFLPISYYSGMFYNCQMSQILPSFSIFFIYLSHSVLSSSFIFICLSSLPFRLSFLLSSFCFFLLSTFLAFISFPFYIFLPFILLYCVRNVVAHGDAREGK